MKAAEVVIGERYMARVSGQRVPVRVLAAHEPHPNVFRRYVQRWSVLNLATGRKVSKTAAALHPYPVAAPVHACEVCGKPTRLKWRPECRSNPAPVARWICLEDARANREKVQGSVAAVNAGPEPEVQAVAS